MIAPFRERYGRALADARLRTNLLTFQRVWKRTRDAAFGRLSQEAPALGAEAASFGDARRRLTAAKDAVLADPPAMQAAFIAAATAAGINVHQAPDAAAARDTILRLLRERNVSLLAKGKSMVAEEVFLNHHLEAAGIRVVETDLGEWIIQLAHETPSHMVMPAIHKSRQQVAMLFEHETGRTVPRDDIQAQVRLAREELRRTFLEAGAGMIGANALIAETGSVMLITNEGNGDLVSTLPRTLIVIAGWEKLVPTFTDATAQLRLLARSATGQEITTYTTFITGAEPGREVHLVLVDNGRTELWSDPDFRDALRCIRCAACADVCPPYQVVGGHVFGYVYSGAIGLVNTPFHHRIDAGAGPQSLCVSCNACATVCPVGIPLPRQILDVRARVAEARGLPWPKRLAFFVWSRPRLFDAAARVAALAQRPLRRGRFLRLPLPAAYRWRTPPALAKRPARDDVLGRTFEPDARGPWAQSNAKGLTVAYFVQCLADRFAPEQAQAAIRVLTACGVRVVVPPDQHCCGLPPLDAGDRQTARRMARQTVEALERAAAGYVVTAAASCAIAMLHDYAHLLHDEPDWSARAERLAARTLDLVSFLDRVANVTVLPPLPKREETVVTYHSFCQSTNVLGLEMTGARLLQHAGFRVVELPEAEVCCGFGGSTSIDHPRVAEQIAARKLANVSETGAAILATDNPGCLLHLRGAADAAGATYEIRHLVELLAEQVDRVAPVRSPLSHRG
ncbi:MAG: LUD domain-containing protein [Chloroflexi bacterium]|nr:LUD domain-containing protein [Chloroflexota bacterium]